MNEFSAKKLGEVHAFCKAGEFIYNKAEHSLHNYFELKTLVKRYYDFATEIESLASQHSVIQQVQKKSEKTIKKLLEMAEMYIADAWDDSAELHEWLGFFLGAAIIHVKLFSGSAEKMDDEQLIKISNELEKFFVEQFERTGQNIKKYATLK